MYFHAEIREKGVYKMSGIEFNPHKSNGYRTQKAFGKLDLLAKQIKSGEYSATFQAMGNKIGTLLGAGQVRENPTAASGL